MFLKKLGLIGLIGGVGLATGACTDGYGYSGVAVGYGNGGYDDGYGYYGDDYYGGYGGDYNGYGGYGGYGYSPAYYGWNGGYYYPGSGYYVYDRYRRPYRWNDSQRHYWENRHGHGGGSNWGHFDPGHNYGRRSFSEAVGDRLSQRGGGNYNRGQYRQQSAAPQRSYSQPSRSGSGGFRGAVGRSLRRR